MAASNADTELLTEHFGYPPVSLLDEIINSINIISEKGLTSVEDGLLKQPPAALGFSKPASTAASNTKSKRKRKAHPPPPPSGGGGDDEQQQQQQPPLSQDEIEARARDEIASGTHQLETLLCTSIDRNFDKFEIYVMRNILCVQPEDRDWMRLGHYEGLDFENLPPAAVHALRGKKKTMKRKKTPAGDGGAMDTDTREEAAATAAAAEEEEEEQEDSDDDEDDQDNERDTPTFASVARLRRRLQASQKLNTMLLAEQARTAALLAELRALVGPLQAPPLPPPHPQQQQQQQSATNAPAAAASAGGAAPAGGQAAPTPPPAAAAAPLAFLRDRGALAQADAAAPLTTTTAFALAQLPALRALGAGLGAVLPALRARADRGGGADAGATGSSGGGGDGERGPHTWRRERAAYVERAARKHLESARGLELGAHGEVHDGEWQGAGPRAGGAEVGALEAVVGLLGQTTAAAAAVSDEGEGQDGDTGGGAE